MEVTGIFVLFLGFCCYETVAKSIKSSENSCTVENEQIAHEKKCNLYYRCVYGIKIGKECPDGMLFNPQIKNCDSSYNVVCGSLETTVGNERYYGEFSDYYDIDDMTTTDILDPKEKLTESDIKCPVKQDPYEPNPLIPHEERCNAFYKCYTDKKYLMKCPGILQFNPKISACDWPQNVRCIDKRLTSTTVSSKETDYSEEINTSSTENSDALTELINKTSNFYEENTSSSNELITNNDTETTNEISD